MSTALKNLPSLPNPRLSTRWRWLALYVESFGVLIVTLGATTPNAVLGSIRLDLNVSDRWLVWVVNSYMIPYGGFLILAGRLGDHFGHRRLFSSGVGLFAGASLLAGLADSVGLLVAARALQGLSAAVVLAVALSLILSQFAAAAERARAIGFYSFACVCGGSTGLLVGGLVGGSLGWRWTFLVNFPLGALVASVCYSLSPRMESTAATARLDWGGASLITAALILASYAILTVPQVGWASAESLGAGIGVAALLTLFVYVEGRAPDPLISLRLLQNRRFTVAASAGVLWTAAQSAWCYFSPLYLQRVLGYDTLEVGLAFLPLTAIIGLLSCGLSASIVKRFGVRLPFVFGVLCCGIGLLLFSTAPGSAIFSVNVLPGMLLIGLGAGVAYNPLVLGAVRDVARTEYGAVAGVLNSSFVMSAAVSLVVLANVAASRTQHLRAIGAGPTAALSGGYHTAFILSALLTGIATALGFLLPVTTADLAETSPQPR